MAHDDGSNVVPLRRPGHVPRTPPTSTASPTARARELAARQSYYGKLAYWSAAREQSEPSRIAYLLAHGTPVPARMTIALDVGGHEGPEVDIACGTVEPAVDNWEAGLEVPTGHQVVLLSRLTGYPVPYFYLPLPEGPLFGPDNGGGVIVCSRSGPKGKRCQVVPVPWVDARGVLHRDGKPAEPADPAKPFQPGLF